MNVVILGNVGSGKGTLCQRLVDDFNYRLISAGDILRSEKASGSKLGKKISALIDDGNYVSDRVVTSLVYKEIKKGLRLDQSFLIDRYPMSVKQALSLDQMILVPIVIWLKVSDDAAIQRTLQRGLTSGRPEDSNIDLIKKRIDIFKKMSIPILEHYDKKIVEVNADVDIESVYKSITDIILNPKIVSVYDSIEDITIMDDENMWVSRDANKSEH